jgi:hypothetical protein
MTNREAHEEAAGMPLADIFFKVNRIDPDAEYVEPKPRIVLNTNLNDLLDETYLLLKRGGKDV